MRIHGARAWLLAAWLAAALTNAHLLVSGGGTRHNTSQESLRPRVEFKRSFPWLRIGIPAITTVMHPGSVFARIWATLCARVFSAFLPVSADAETKSQHRSLSPFVLLACRTASRLVASSPLALP